jgi:DNA replication licensing factor MCM4
MVSEDPRVDPDSEYYTVYAVKLLLYLFSFRFNEKDVTDDKAAEREQKLRDLARSPDIYDKLTKSLAPSIWEMDDIKKGILCQLFGGTNKEYTETGIGRFRGEINVLLVGDPGTSKSQLLQYL